MQLCPGRAAGCELTVVWGDAHPRACAGPQLQRGCATLGVCWALSAGTPQPRTTAKPKLQPVL